MTLEANRQEPAFVHRIRLRARRRILWLRALWASGTSPLDLAMAISHDEVDRALTDPREMRLMEEEFYRLDPDALQLAEPILEADAVTAADPLLGLLRRRFGLTEQETDLLTLAVAMDLDPQIRRAYGYLNDDASACHATPLLASQLFSWPRAERFGSDSPLVRWLLVRPADGLANSMSLAAPWAADPFVVSLALDGKTLDPALGAAVTWAEAPADLPSLYASELLSMHAFYEALHHEGCRRIAEGLPALPIEIEIIGASGSGKRTLAAQLCGMIGKPMLIADAGKLMEADTAFDAAFEQAIRAIRAALLTDAILYWRDAGAAPPKIWSALTGYTSETLYGSASPLPPPIAATAARKSVRLGVLSQAQRKALWRHLSDLPVPPPVANWLLTPADIAGAALVASAGPDGILGACRKPPMGIAGTLVTPLPCPYTWDDMVLPASVKQHLGELEAQTRLRWEVYEDWGFHRLCPGGRGITAMFAGPSGTGKTMAAQVVARSLEMELYRVDLASVMSKYIGETEKNLKQIFDACDQANVLLFFDEADALFGQRTQVKDAHDRFANIEIDYLLQRMEQFDGIAVLATNRKGEIDKAFLRRIRFIVDFMPPGPDERLTLWRLALPSRTPSGEILTDQIDWRLLADKLNMTGADIKSAALGAAFLANAEGTRIGMRHIVHAARREMTKHGMVVRDLEG